MDWCVLEGAAKTSRPCQILKLIKTDVYISPSISPDTMKRCLPALSCECKYLGGRGLMLGCQGTVALCSLPSGCCSEMFCWVYLDLSLLAGFVGALQ